MLPGVCCTWYIGQIPLLPILEDPSVRTSLFVLVCLALFTRPGIVGAENNSDLQVAGKRCALRLQTSDGAICYFGLPGGRESIFRSGPAGLWEATLADGRTLRAADFSEPGRTVRSRIHGQSLRLEYSSAELDAVVIAEARDDSVELRAEVTPHQQPLIAFGLPGRLEFRPERLVRFVCPASGNESVGFGLRPGFFQPQATKAGYYEYRAYYPPAFADFFHWETADGAATVYRIEPRTWEPWQGARDRRAIFTPGRIAAGGGKTGAWCERPFAPYVAKGETWPSPVVRLAMGGTPAEQLGAYCRANQIRRRLDEKMPPALLEKFKQSVLVYYPGDCRQKRAGLERLPRPALVHFADYLRGGFDKQYPDHLPPAADFGSPDEFRAFLAEAQRLGHLVMPYTNPTWWCDGPRGPTFLEQGETPLLRLLDGRLAHERYSKNEGFTICHWHPAVQAANRKTITQFSDEYPVDVIFQDQCGARRWQFDMNPASPTPSAYVEGLLSMVTEDARRKPLSTESGWDGVVNDEAQLCGMTWGIVPTEGMPKWVRRMREYYHPATWEVFPLAQYIAHDKTAMIHHDLGQFVTNPQVLSWTLGLGFAMSDRISGPGLAREPARQWLLWLDRLQKSVCARHMGKPLDGFEHDRGGTGDDGVIRTRYADLTIVANLDPRSRTESGHQLAPFGFLCTAPGLVAANLQSLGGRDFGPQGVSFVSQQRAGADDVWVYASAEQEVSVLLPAERSGKVTLAFDDGRSAAGEAQGGVCRFRLPAVAGRTRIEPPADLARAPRDWPGARPAVGVVDFGPGVGGGWTRITPRQWLDAFQQSRLAREWNVPVRAIQTPAELRAALAAGPRAWLAIVNPYGEQVPSIGDGLQTLEAIRAYVNHGGCWWETGGHSFIAAVRMDDGRVQRESLGPKGLEHLGLATGHGEVDQPSEPIAATADGRQWLGAALADRLAQRQAIVNRSLPRGTIDAPHVTLVAGREQDYLGGYRLDGWGWLWRVGGFWPEADVVLPVAVAATEYLYTHAPLPVATGGGRYVWHANVTVRRGN